mgnify:CR=1 FL=1
MRLRILAARGARSFVSTMPSGKKRRAQGKPDALSTRSRVHSDAHGRPQARRNTRPSLRNGFNGLWRALPGDEFVLPPSLPDGDRSKPGRVRQISDGLTPATGARTTRFGRPQLSRSECIVRPACCRDEVQAGTFKRRSSARRSIAHRPKPALRPRTRPTLLRPPHPTARS